MIRPIMVRRCAMCSVKKSEDVGLHIFPKEEHLLAKWKIACGFSESDCVDTLVICSKHFKLQDYIQYTKSGGSADNVIRKLKRNVVPSVHVPYIVENNSPNVPQPSETQPKTKKVEVIKESCPTSNDTEITTPRNNENIKVLDEEIVTPVLAKGALYHARYIQNQLRKKVKSLQRDNRRLKKRVAMLEELVKELTTENCDVLLERNPPMIDTSINEEI